MIHYDLRCASGHDFDGWFASSVAFDRQAAAGLLECPECGSPTVERALMSPAVASRPRIAAPQAAREDTAASEAASEPPNVALIDERAVRMRAMLRAMHEAVKATGVDVGRSFPEEARKIHYGEADARGIYGQANVEEARALIEEGISIMPMPPLPEETN